MLAHCCPWGWQCHPRGVGEGAYRWGPGAFLWGLGLEVAIGYEGLVGIEYALRATYLPRGVVAVLVEPVQHFQTLLQVLYFLLLQQPQRVALEPSLFVLQQD